MLSGLLYPTDPPRCAKALSPIVAQLLVPDWAYTPASARHVARASRRLAIPDYDEIEKAMGEWWRDHRPPYTAIGEDKPRGWDDRDEAWFRYWFKRKAENFAPVPGLDAPPGGLTWQAHVASLIREASPRAWGRIAGAQ